MTFGLILGIMTQIVVVGAGLGALIAASSLGFGIVKWLGVAYLAWLGIQQWRAPAVPLVAATEAGAATRRQLFLRGWAINAVNPKGTVFLLAVVPQFLDLHASLAQQYGVIAATLAFTRCRRDGRLHGAGRAGAVGAAFEPPDPHHEPQLRQPVHRRRHAAGDVQARELMGAAAPR